MKLAEERNPEVKFGVSYITDVAMALSDHEAAVAKVSKLEGFHNYSVWGFKVENLLNRDDLRDMVTMDTNLRH